jgi:hypothetical protein
LSDDFKILGLACAALGTEDTGDDQGVRRTRVHCPPDTPLTLWAEAGELGPPVSRSRRMKKPRQSSYPMPAEDAEDLGAETLCAGTSGCLSDGRLMVFEEVSGQLWTASFERDNRMGSKFTAAVAVLATFAAALPSLACAETNDACALLTAAEVSAALGTGVGAGQPVTLNDHKGCTWKVTDGYSWVTVMFQALTAFESGKTLANDSKSTALTPVSSLGEDAYYMATGDQVGLVVKKGAFAFKVEVYQPNPLWSKKASERILAEKVLSRL